MFTFLHFRLVSEEDQSWFSATLEELAVKHFCMPRSDPKTEMSAISEEPSAVGFEHLNIDINPSIWFKLAAMFSFVYSQL